jgi:hypothetical protein
MADSAYWWFWAAGLEIARREGKEDAETLSTTEERRNGGSSFI